MLRLLKHFCVSKNKRHEKNSVDIYYGRFIFVFNTEEGNLPRWPDQDRHG